MTDPAVEAARRAGMGEFHPRSRGLAIESAREALAPLRELHKRVTDGGGRPGCSTCGWVDGWPCSTAGHIYREDEL